MGALNALARTRDRQLEFVTNGICGTCKDPFWNSPTVSEGNQSPTHQDNLPLARVTVSAEQWAQMSAAQRSNSAQSKEGTNRDQRNARRCVACPSVVRSDHTCVQLLSDD
jgi:hypothetical protein